MAGARPHRPHKNQGLYSGNVVGFDLGKLITVFACVEDNGQCFSLDSLGEQSQQISICLYTCKRTKTNVPAPTGRQEEKGAARGKFLLDLPFVLLRPSAGGRTPAHTGIQTLI